MDEESLTAQLAAMAVPPEAEAVLLELASALFPGGVGTIDRVTWSGRPAPDEASLLTGEAPGAPEPTEARLRAAEVRYRTLVEQIPAVTFMAMLGEGKNEVYVSPHIETLLGFTQTEWLEDPFLWYTQLHPDDRTIWIDEFARGCRTGGPFRAECRFLARDGHVVWVRGEARLVKDERGRPLFLQGVAFDITESKRAQDVLLATAVQTTEARYRDVVEGIGAIFWEADPVTLRFTFVSQQAERLLGFPRERWLEDPTFWMTMVDADDADGVAHAWREAVREGAEREIEYRVVTADGQPRWLHNRVHVVRGMDGRPRHLLGFMVDVTDRKQAEVERTRMLAREREARTEAETARQTAESANRAKDEFLATLSHELRTPLNVILGWARVLRSRPFDPAGVEKALAVIERNATAQAQLIEDLLDVSRIIVGKFQIELRPVDDLAPIVHAVIDSFRPTFQAKGVTLDLAIEPEVGPISADPARLQQVVWNLVSNAVKFTPAGRAVTVSCRQIGGSAEIRVIDTGQGIPAAFLPHLFDRFTQADSTSTRAHGGLGLGLSIVRHLVELHGGTVRAESAGVDRGATFIVRLPLAGAARIEAPLRAPVRSGQAGGAAVQGLRVVLVEDDDDARALLAGSLEQAGATVMAVTGADVALPLIQSWKPDVVVLDIGLPGQDGYSLIRQIRALPPSEGGGVPAVAVTAYASIEDRQRALAAGFQIHVAKPADPSTVVEAVALIVAATRGS